MQDAWKCDRSKQEREKSNKTNVVVHESLTYWSRGTREPVERAQEPREGPEGRDIQEPPADGARATTEEGEVETQAPPQGDTLDPPQDQPTLTPPPATQGQARPTAADFMAQAADTPLMITERGEGQEQGRAMAAPAGNQPEVPE